LKVIEKTTIKLQPGKYKTLKNSCTRMQAIIDRGLLHKKMNKKPTYEEDLGFYRIIIPGLDKRLSKESGKTRHAILKRVAEEWIAKNLETCSKYITTFNKAPLQYNYPKKARVSLAMQQAKEMETQSFPRKSSSSRRSTPDVFRMSKAKLRRSSSKEF